MKHPLTIFILLCIGLFGCVEYDPRLVAVDKQADTDPTRAMAMLDSIDRTGFSERNLRYYDLLWIKTRDKAYVSHTSDSVISRVAGYYESRSGDRLYPEAMYYAGRVYGELGDFPIALDYFHEALDAVPASDLHLRGNILSQTARLLDVVRMYRCAIPYLKSALVIDSLENDTFNLAYDYDLLGGIYMRADEYDSAMYCYREAERLAVNLLDEDRAEMDLNYAAIHFEKGNVDSALIYIEGVPERVAEVTRGLAFAYACHIYYEAGEYGKAEFYAKELVKNPYSANKKTGYMVLTSPELLRRQPIDSATRLLNDYKKEIEKHLNKHDAQAMLIQNAQYNYSLHKRERIKAEKQKERIEFWLNISFVAILLLLIVALILIIRYRNKKIETLNALSRINKLIHIRANLSATARGNEPETFVESVQEVDMMRAALIETLEKTSADSPQKTVNPIALLNEGLSGTIQKYIDEGNPIPDVSDIWNEIEKAISEYSPDFKARIMILCRGSISTNEYRTAMLIKCGLSLTHMAILLGRSKSSISGRRDSLCVKMFDKKLTSSVIEQRVRIM